MPFKLPGAVVFLFLFSCGKPLPSVNGLDSDEWKGDKNGCKGKRLEMSANLHDEIQKVRGLSEMEVIALLGKPDQNELYRRNQKFYYYFISPGPGCETADTIHLRLSVRFNAMGYAQLVAFDQKRFD